MDLSNDLISQFAKITKDQNKSPVEAIVYGTVVSYGDKLYVNIDGSNSITPVVTTSEIKSGERVTILLKDHSATILGNVTNPAASTETVGKVLDEYDVIVAKIGDFELLIADKITTEQLEAELAIINEALIGKATIEQLNAVDAKIENLNVSDLEADIAKINEAIIEKADIEDLNAVHADIDVLEADVANIETLVGGNLTMDNIQSLILTTSKVTVDNAFVKDAMIDRVSASKLSAGTINTNLINIGSEDGAMTINGSLQQFKDADGNVRIQIGKDAQGNFTFCLFSQDGVGVLLDETGLKAGAVPDGLIVNDMVADNANISGGKLDISSVVTAINGNTTSINSSIIQFDDTGQSLTLAFNSLKNKVDTLEEINISGDLSTVIEQVTSNTTNIEIMLGDIETLISNSTIVTENGQVVQLKDDYLSTKQTVNEMEVTISSFETTYGDSIKEVSAKQTEFEADLDGFKTTVSDTYATKTELTDDIIELDNALNDNITSAVDKAKNDTLDEVADKYTLNKDYEEFTKMTTSSIEQTNNKVDTTFTSVTTNIQSVNGQLTEFKNTVDTHIRMDSDGISIGKSDSPFSVNISNQKMSFKEQGTEVAYISDKEMRITDAVIENSMVLGNFKFIPRITGNMSLIWDDLGNIINYNESYCNKTNNNYPTHSASFIESPIAGEIYTVELCASVPEDNAYWGIYNSGGIINVTNVYPWEFDDGIGKRSFIWKDGDNNYVSIYYIIPGGTTNPVKTISFIKIYKGDDLWKDNGNYIRFNNYFDFPTGSTGVGYHMVADYDDYYNDTGIYGYFEEGVEYKFSCEVDGGEGYWGDWTDEDTVYAWLVNNDVENGLLLPITPEDTFIIPTSGRWWLRLDVNKNGCSHWFSNMWITKA